MPTKSKIKQIIDVVLKVHFPDDTVPELFNDLEIIKENSDKLVLEVQKH